MASGLYAKAKQSFLANEIKWVTGTTDAFRVFLVDTADYAVNLANDEFATVLSGTAVVATGTIANPSAALGVADGDDVTLTAVVGDVSEALVIVKWTGSIATSRVIAYIDTVASGLPVTPNGGNITITWDNGANKIFAL
jgi:hypothetical protein